MRKKLIISTLLVMASLAGFAHAEDKPDELVKLRKQVRTQQQQLKGLMKRLDQLEQHKQTPEPEAQPALETRVAELEAKADTLDKRVTEDSNVVRDKMAWASKTKVKADVRVRFDHDKVDNATSKNRMRFRARAGVYGNITDEIYSGIRVASGSDDRATSANQDFTNWAHEKNAWIDLAYIGYMPEYAEGLDLIIGKIKKPWIDVDSMFWDGDVNPEGASAVYDFNAGPVDFRAHGGYFIMSEGGNDDVTLTSAQLSGKVDVHENVAVR
ncbi:MAG: putative porin, partial [Kiritimatiellales bacterium]|nr:putative porin [Kiritimatiellales bacterium]